MGVEFTYIEQPAPEAVAQAYLVAAPERYGVLEFADDGTVVGLVEKPSVAPSNYAVTGLYFLDGSAHERARRLAPSGRGELEIISLLELYHADAALHVERLGRGHAWLDTSTHASLLDAGNFVRTLTERHGLQTGCPEEIAHQMGWISDGDLMGRAVKFQKNGYGSYLRTLLH